MFNVDLLCVLGLHVFVGVLSFFTLYFSSVEVF